MHEQSDQSQVREQILNHPTVVAMDEHEQRDVERNTAQMSLVALDDMLRKLNEGE